jgi:hypothetical protein
VIWLEDAENDLGELEMKRWKQKANNRKEYASVIKRLVFLHNIQLRSKSVSK